MAGSEPRIDPELLGRVASLSPGQQRWLRTVVASVFSMDDAGREEAAAVSHERKPKRRRETPRASAPEKEAAPREPSSEPLEKVLRGEGVTEEEYPELADDLQGIADIAELLRESGRERRRFGEELLRLLESSESSDGSESESEDEPEDE